jgi:hypothetical protein
MFLSVLAVPTQACLKATSSSGSSKLAQINACVAVTAAAHLRGKQQLEAFGLLYQLVDGAPAL